MDRGSKIVNYFYKVINVLLEPLTNNSIEGYPVVTEEIVDSDFEFENARITVYSRACETLARVWRDLIINQCQKKTYFIEFTTDCSPMTIHRKAGVTSNSGQLFDVCEGTRPTAGVSVPMQQPSAEKRQTEMDFVLQRKESYTH
ncbi:hypothetical protein PGB90_000124 [Kerria lacca]